jgi:hypothetical protein
VIQAIVVPLLSLDFNYQSDAQKAAWRLPKSRWRHIGRAEEPEATNGIRFQRSKQSCWG